MSIIKHELIITKTPPQKTTYIVGVNLLDNLSLLDHLKDSNADKFLLLTDENLFALYGKRTVEALKKTGREVTTAVVAAGEKSKTLRSVELACKAFLEGKVGRSSILVALGGGVITDLGGFIGAILLRGIRVIHIPTTLLAQIDAAIGGKSGVDFWTDEGMLKNMIGKIEQPLAVISDISLLLTLPEKEILNGLGEMVKYWAGWKEPSLRHLGGVAKRLLRGGGNKKDSFQEEELAKTISACQKIKIDVIKKDPFEMSGLREKLNLGHTIGHAIEAEAKGKLSHGQCVAIGLVGAVKISLRMNFLAQSQADEIIEAIKTLGLPVSAEGLNADKVFDLTAYDKKGGTFVMINDIGRITSGVRVEPKLIKKVLSEIIL